MNEKDFWELGEDGFFSKMSPETAQQLVAAYTKTGLVSQDNSPGEIRAEIFANAAAAIGGRPVELPLSMKEKADAAGYETEPLDHSWMGLVLPEAKRPASCEEAADLLIGLYTLA